jgi:HAD superfamily hydrolase (TIGR01509 family)
MSGTAYRPHEVVLSCEVGYAKPDARIYAIALDRIRADPGDVLFIDDTKWVPLEVRRGVRV